LDLLQALNVTIYGLGIVFLALLVLMVAIMLLSKLFSVATGTALLEAPTGASTGPAGRTEVSPPLGVPAPLPAARAPETGPPEAAEAVPAPLPGKILAVAVKAGDRVRAGDELCVIEALKMANSVKSPRDGTVLEVAVAAGDAVGFGATLVLLAATAAPGAARRLAPGAAPASPREAAAAPAAFALDVAGSRHSVDLAAGDAVVLDGVSYQVRRDPADPRRILVNGAPHTVEVKERGATGALVVVDGVAQQVDVAPRAVPPPAAFTLTCEGRRQRVEVRASGEGMGQVSVGGTTYEVKRDAGSRSRLLVDGKPHAVEIQERTVGGARVWIDGRLHEVAVAAEPAAPAAEPAASSAVSPPAPARRPPAGPAAGGETITAPLPGKILSVAVQVGDRVAPGAEVCVIEALKMANSIKAQRAGAVREVLVAPGQSVGFGVPLIVLG
jgi:glutaconyl-CoA decarboxylase